MGWVIQELLQFFIQIRSRFIKVGCIVALVSKKLHLYVEGTPISSVHIAISFSTVNNVLLDDGTLYCEQLIDKGTSVIHL